MVRLKNQESDEVCKVYDGDISANQLFDDSQFALKKFISRAQRVIDILFSNVCSFDQMEKSYEGNLRQNF